MQPDTRRSNLTPEGPERARHYDWNEKQLTSAKVVQRLRQLLSAPQVASGAVQHTLKPGWMWTYAYTDLIEEGKRLRHALDNTPIEAPPF